MKITTLILSTLLLLPLTSMALELTQAEKAELNKGSIVKRVVWKQGYIWPEVTIVSVLNHSPLDNMNVFLDFEAQKNYVPDMLESRVVKKISADEFHVYFEMSMPWPVKKSTHTTNNVITHNPDGSHILKWNLVKAEMLKSTDGYIQFSPYQGKTLLTYVSQIVPNSSFATMFKDRVASDVEKSVQKISRHLTKTLNKKDSLFSTSRKEVNQNNL